MPNDRHLKAMLARHARSFVRQAKSRKERAARIRIVRKRLRFRVRFAKVAARIRIVRKRLRFRVRFAKVGRKGKR